VNAITIQMPDDLLEKIELLAKTRDVDLEDLIVEVMNAAVLENEARALS
jgi:predicted transcriptional regulator